MKNFPLESNKIPSGHDISSLPSSHSTIFFRKLSSHNSISDYIKKIQIFFFVQERKDEEEKWNCWCRSWSILNVIIFLKFILSSCLLLRPYHNVHFNSCTHSFFTLGTAAAVSLEIFFYSQLSTTKGERSRIFLMFFLFLFKYFSLSRNLFVFFLFLGCCYCCRCLNEAKKIIFQIGTTTDVCAFLKLWLFISLFFHCATITKHKMRMRNEERTKDEFFFSSYLSFVVSWKNHRTPSTFFILYSVIYYESTTEWFFFVL